MCNQHVFCIKKDKEVVASILKYCKEKNIECAWISAVGAVKSATLKNYDLEKREYQERKFYGRFEVVSLSGNIGLLGRKPVSHLHAILSDEEMKTFGGHLEEAIVSVTCEVFVQPIKKEIVREFDQNIGLNLIK